MTGEQTFQSSQYEDELGADLDFRGVRMPALVLDQMLAGAVAFTDATSEPFIPLDAVQLQVATDAEHLNIHSTDRYPAGAVLVMPLNPPAEQELTERELIVLFMPVKPDATAPESTP